MLHRVLFSENAVGDLRAIVEYISERNQKRARTFVATLRDRIIKKLSIFPESGIEVGRHRVTTFGNYVVIYSCDRTEGVVTIAMITEAHRNWRALFEDK